MAKTHSLLTLLVRVHHLRACADEHRKFQLEYARAMVEQAKRGAIDGPEEKLPTSVHRTGRGLTRTHEAETEKRKLGNAQRLA